MKAIEKLIKNQLEDLVGKRFNKETLEAKLSEIFGHPAKVEDVSKDDDELADFNRITNCDNTETDIYGYADIYYLPMRREGFDGSTFYVTEVSYEFE